MLTESSFKKKYILILFFTLLALIKTVEGKNTGHLYLLNSANKYLYTTNLPDRLVFGISYFNIFRDKKSAFEGRLEYRSSFEFLNLQPFTGISFTSSGAYYGMVGLYSDIALWNNIIFTPSFAAGYFNKGYGLDLAYELEFRTHCEISYALKNNSRIGLGFYHISNGNLGRSNPGAETFTLIYSLPID